MQPQVIADSEIYNLDLQLIDRYTFRKDLPSVYNKH